MKLLFALTVLSIGAAVVPRRADGSPPDDRELFERQVWPVLKEDCLKCHGGARVRNGLDVSTREDLLRGGENGPAIVPGDPEKSLLIRAVRYEGNYHMPPKGKLKPEQVNDLVEWVRHGAPWPAK